MRMGSSSARIACTRSASIPYYSAPMCSVCASQGAAKAPAAAALTSYELRALKMLARDLSFHEYRMGGLGVKAE
jgi:hypothetical protein